MGMALRGKPNVPTPKPSTSSEPVDRSTRNISVQALDTSTPNISKTEMLMRAAELKVVNSWNRDKAPDSSNLDVARGVRFLITPPGSRAGSVVELETELTGTTINS